ncbi:DUF4258 domain-containing protein [Amphritea sp.]|uniref:DUF4258 domain-containing protein n=1 Tax=Amphritea sp. TaxID=1872502 RepID=UPI003A95111A
MSQKETGVFEDLELTEHARQRMNQRGVSEQAVELALQFGRKIHSRRALFHVIGKKEINKLGDQHPELKELDGVQVLTTEDSESIITVYRNHDLRAIRPNKRKHRHLH